MTFGNKITYHRKQKGFTQEDLAQLLGVSNQAVSKWEADKSYPDIKLLPEIADIFEISIDEFFDRRVTAQSLPWTNDGSIHAVLYVGTRMIDYCDESNNKELVFEEKVKNVFSLFNVRCGDVKGNATVRGGVNCGNIGGHAEVVGGVNCGNVGGYLHVEGGVNCGNIGEYAQVSGDVNCGNVDGNLDACGNVNCGDVNGDLTTCGDVTCEEVSGNVITNGDVTCENVNGDVTCGGRFLKNE